MSEKDKFLGEFEQMTMLALLQLDDEAYGAAIRQLLAEQVNRNVAIGALYSTLERLERKGMVESRLGEATAQRGGRAKRYFKVTAQGHSALKRARQAMDTLWQGLSVRHALCQEGEL
ncbi:PadR family transcriptional regulator [Pseudoalteromonas rubra]|uniref:PadR family transcriptional regulator n=1 Tax=Pseudoalteromonas rubra TaxID=43658 RepID=A0A0U3HSJ8_9GAMM|nr:PadR family transcriptional regulator [Pseudoalteromonas rubra]ALU43944.1 PadR family transcriptional regulator [Pseudoalteromonas rubra]